MTYHYNSNRTHSQTRTTDARKNSRPWFLRLLSIPVSVRHQVGKLRLVALDDASLPSISADSHKQITHAQKCAMMSWTLAAIVVFASLSTLADDGDWAYWVYQYGRSTTPISTYHDVRLSCDSAQIMASSHLPLFRVTSGFSAAVSTSPVVTNVVDGSYLAGSYGYSHSNAATLYSGIVSFVESLANSGLDPTPFCVSVSTNGNVVYYRQFQTFPFIGSGLINPRYNSSVLSFLSSLGASASNILDRVLHISQNSDDSVSLLRYIAEDNGDILNALYPNSLSAVDLIYRTLTPSASNLAERIYMSGLTGGGTPYYWLRDLGYDNHFTFDAHGFVLSATPMGMNLLQQKYAASASYDADRQQLVNSLMGYRVNGDTYTRDGASNFQIDGRTLSMADLQSATLPELWSYQARVNMAVDTNDVRRLGRSLVDPESASNVRKRALDQQATQDAITGALNNRVIPVNVQNWPVDGLKVKFDDPTIELAGGQYSTVQSIDTNLQQLRTAFQTWSGVDDGGRWLPVQDSVLTNLYAIAESLLSLTNRNNDVSNILYSVATSNQLHEIQSEADAFLAQAENDYHEISGLFDAERYIEFRHTNLNFLASSQFAPLRQLADNGSQLPDYINLQVGAFGSYQFPTVTVNVSHVAPLCNASRWFFRCVWVVLSCLFYWFLGVYAFRFYRWVTGKFTGMGYYMS